MSKVAKFLITTALCAIALPTVAMAGPIAGTSGGNFSTLSGCDSSMFLPGGEGLPYRQQQYAGPVGYQQPLLFRGSEHVDGRYFGDQRRRERDQCQNRRTDLVQLQQPQRSGPGQFRCRLRSDYRFHHAF